MINLSDIFTKGLARRNHNKWIELIGLRQLGKKIESQISIKSINLTVKSKSDTSIKHKR